jgi:putative membrane protein
MRWIINFLITAVFVYVLSKLLAPHVIINSFTTAIIFSIVLALLNAFVKPLVIILTLPLTIITLGLFLLVINVVMILLADKFVSGIKIDSFLWAFIFGLLLSIVSTVTHKLKRKWTL